MVHDAFIKAFGDSDIQQYILGRNDQNIILEDIIKFVEAKEAGRRSTSLQNLSASTLFSYKQLDKDQHLVKCRKCGKSGEDDRRDTQARKEKCKSWDKICSHCDKRNHVADVCRSKPKKTGENTAKDVDEPNLVFPKYARSRQPAQFSPMKPVNGR